MAVVNRREMLKALAAVPAVAMLGKAPTGHVYGYMDVDRWFLEGHFGKRVLVDGTDVTDRCQWFDDTTGEAYVFADSPPRPDASGLRLRMTILRGRIEVRP